MSDLGIIGVIAYLYGQDTGERVEMEVSPPEQRFLLAFREYVRNLPEPQGDECKRCGFPVVSYDGGASWVHRLGGRRGCRAASFDRLGGAWDDALPPHWYAAPSGVAR